MTYFPRFASAVALFLVLGLAATLPARAADAPSEDSPQALIRFFQTKVRDLPAPPIDFQFTGGYAIIRTGTPESSGRYAMTSMNVARIAPEIYRLDVSLEKPLPRNVPTYEQPYFFTEQRSYYFWYQNGEQIIFKAGGKKIALPLGRKDVLRVDIKTPDTYSIDRDTMLKNLTFDDGSVTIHLQLKFN